MKNLLRQDKQDLQDFFPVRPVHPVKRALLVLLGLLALTSGIVTAQNVFAPRGLQALRRATASSTSPTFVAAGTAGVAATGNVTPGWPAGLVANDIVICIWHASGTTAAGTMSGDWTSIAQADGASTSRLGLWWHRYDGVTTPSTTITVASGATQIAGLAGFRNAKASGSPIGVAGTIQSQSASTSIAIDAVTCPDNNSLVLACNGIANDNTRTDLSGFTATFNPGANNNVFLTTLGTPDGSVNMFYKIVNSGTTGIITVTQSAATVGTKVQITLSPL